MRMIKCAIDIDDMTCRSFETGIENIRRSVVNTNRKLRMSEVEDLTNKLTQIGRNAAKLKSMRRS